MVWATPYLKNEFGDPWFFFTFFIESYLFLPSVKVLSFWARTSLKTVLKVFFGMSNNLRRIRDVTFIDCVTSFISSTFCCELGWKIINQWTEKTLKVKLHKNGKLTLISGNPFLQEPAEINRKRQITVRVLLYNNRLFYSCVLSYPATEWKRGLRWPRFDKDLSAFLI